MESKPDAQISRTDPAGVLERWLGLVPILCVFGLCAWVTSWPRYSELFANLRVDLPVFTKTAIALSSFLSSCYYLWLPVMFGIAYVYFAWACKKGDRHIWFSLLLTLAFFVLFFVFFDGIFLPLVKIQEALLKR